jgi:hypothetical protein
VKRREGRERRKRPSREADLRLFLKDRFVIQLFDDAVLVESTTSKFL